MNNEFDLVDNSSYDMLHERCNSCIWFDSGNGVCDHCGYGYPYCDNNGLRPHEVKSCDIYRENESLKYEWQWAVYNSFANKFELSSFHSMPNDPTWIKFEPSKRLKK